ncbi:hypothetical protein X275_11050 [Marinitoga sp. 1197]|uniref:IS110 family transposase n=1 Tax=Marinitoga sp. 1197 TaxID=1428449 RepID=UPI0006412147|nr:IS110 family transposase [Marinitoga sp. 1197]KLO20831.1 hypothetical protein X275_11050 [Marinitoga sp. 1197]
MRILAIDVSKSSLDFFSNFIGSGSVNNSPQGIFDLFSKALSVSKDFILVLESTGVYSFDVASYFYDNSIKVFWVKTDNMKLYRKILNRSKTDKLDARLIFDIALNFQNSLVPFVSDEETISELRYLTRLYLKFNGDINCFNNASALASYTGLTWSIHQSEKFKAQDSHLEKKGNKYLRTYLVLAANSLKTHNPIFKDYYWKKYRESNKYHHMRALVMSARKLVNLVFYLLKNNTPYVILK